MSADATPSAPEHLTFRAADGYDRSTDRERDPVRREERKPVPMEDIAPTPT